MIVRQSGAACNGWVLERVPESQLSWRPHSKSMTLGQLALHVASIPGDIAGLAQLEGFDASMSNFEPAMPESNAQIYLRSTQASLPPPRIFKR